MKDRLEQLSGMAQDALQRLVRELLSRKPGGHLLESDLRKIELRLRLTLDGSESGTARFSEQLVGTIDRLLDDAVHRAAAFRPGRAYCHRCTSAECEHTLPPTCRDVCVGYSPTGLPRWQDFAQFCLDLKHPEVDRLYDRPPAFLALVQGERELHGGMLDAFTDRSYRLLGQVTAGFFTVRARAEEGRGVLALTLQAGASRTATGPLKLGLNVLGRAPNGEDIGTLWERQSDLPWRRALRWAQAAMETLERPHAAGRGVRAARERAALEHRVSGILQGLARRLDRDQRARGRRTSHAQHRHASGERPTRKAVDDARSATLETLAIDERRDTVVVLGERGRTHFFTRDGRLVSSVRYDRDAVERKIKRELWRQALPDELEAFRKRLPE